uniref:Uncharacterized protein n=1 Tax=Mucochytrium quahogii TaxID=96639 RepID=A0A7S2SME7_9STRA|mmetsp:Transcript_17310/g.27950  ORF Transcript_17310/g.27950 Transcript_17310/m.27950 type:complete len:145 (-) Transcript_17310:875-1309(-)|eukprot:CAMPEP_0203758782 /NCGR_PEP_ID=MMETSP0098-20131031/11632_1 /ASSEMBLY_ACC=CAM_ASM_000208 /TAXON_ID=96639 /ORGANISM=" , Strain NY0313808BC1" /LENGTH=144 /DNA_ID=CAMNT_0050651377 /DNA_START=252 /DNA_END=686 /DNA_ORIENTATION=-
MANRLAVDLRPNPFACRGRQFCLRVPVMSQTEELLKKRNVWKRMLGETFDDVREENESRRGIIIHEAEQKTKDEELDLQDRVRDLEQRKATLKLLLQQVLLDQKAKQEGKEQPVNADVGEEDKRRKKRKLNDTADESKVESAPA